jgi:hypothetical protein
MQRIARAPVAVTLLMAALLMCREHAFAAELGAFPATAISRDGLNLAQAKKVLTLVLRHEGYDLKKRGMYIDDDIKTPEGGPPHPGYVDLSLQFDARTAGATAALGYFAVSKKTGDVWEVNRCKRYRFPELSRIQRLIMQRTGTSLADEREQWKGLGCAA